MSVFRCREIRRGGLCRVPVAFVALWGALALAPPQAQAGQSCFADYNGSRVHYQDVGQGPRAVVFIHGWSCDHTFWRGQVTEISRKYRVIALDLPGHGQSDKPKRAYTQDYLAGGVAAVLARAGVQDAVLVGHSMGASLAWRLARSHPQAVRAVVVVDGAFVDVPRETKAQLEAFLRPFQGPNYRDTVVKFIEAMLGPAITPELKKEIIAKMLATPRQVGLSALENFADPAVWKKEPVNQPALAIYAQSKELPPDFDKFLRRFFLRLQYRVWTGVGHFFMMERPGELNRELLGFIKGIE